MKMAIRTVKSATLPQTHRRKRRVRQCWCVCVGACGVANMRGKDGKREGRDGVIGGVVKNVKYL